MHPDETTPSGSVAEPDVEVTSSLLPLSGGGAVTVRYYRHYRPGSGGSKPAWLVLAHGAGAGHDHPFMRRAAIGLAARGVAVATFNFPYREAGRRMPDPPRVLEGCLLDVVAAVRAHATGAVFAGGKSMGGRIATQVVAGARGTPPVAGLVLLGYPLHPPGRPAQLRSAHLPAIGVPMLVVQGEGDRFGTPDELRAVFSGLRAPVTLHVVAGGDHSLDVPRRLCRDATGPWTRWIDAVDLWIRQVAERDTGPAPSGRPVA